MDADRLLSGPRGRGFVLTLVDSDEVRQLGHRADAAARPRGQSASFGWFDSSQSRRGFGRFEVIRARRAARAFQEEMRRPVSPRELADAIREHAPEATPGVSTIVAALARSVDGAKPYQRPDGREGLLATPEVLAALRPVAELVAYVDLESCTGPQWRVDFESGRTIAHRPPAEVLREAADHDGHWWTSPPGELPITTGALPGVPDIPAGLVLVEDAFGGDAALVTPVAPDPAARVLELASAEDFANLTRDFPRRASAHQSDSWSDATGRDGEWLSPDWAAVAQRWDAVHLTLAAYLEGATRAIDLGDGSATIIAGWSPEATYWLMPAPASGPAVRWVRSGQLGWRPEA